MISQKNIIFASFKVGLFFFTSASPHLHRPFFSTTSFFFLTLASSHTSQPTTSSSGIIFISAGLVIKHNNSPNYLVAPATVKINLVSHVVNLLLLLLLVKFFFLGGSVCYVLTRSFILIAWHPIGAIGNEAENSFQLCLAWLGFWCISIETINKTNKKTQQKDDFGICDVMWNYCSEWWFKHWWWRVFCPEPHIHIVLTGFWMALKTINSIKTGGK